MANAPSKFEQMIVNNGPVQASVIRHLTRWEFRNLQLAGVRFPVNQEFLKKHLVHDRCHEITPETVPMEQCANTTGSLDESEIRACAGYPLAEWGTDPKWLGSEEMQFCRSFDNNPQLSKVNDEPNIEKHPIHFKVCRRCREYGRHPEFEVAWLTIEDCRVPLCKPHSLEHTNQLPLNSCRCFAYISEKWTCGNCYHCAQYYLWVRAKRFPFNRYLWSVAIPWSQPWVYLKMLHWRFLNNCHRALAHLMNFPPPFKQFPWSVAVVHSRSRQSLRRLCHKTQSAIIREQDIGKQYCPLPDCFEPSWMDETRSERMQIFCACNAIIRI